MKGRALILQADALRLPLPDESVDLIVSSPPYFALRSYRDNDEHYAGQLGSEPTPQAFLEALWSVMAECWRVLKPTGSCFINLGDKRSGSGGHNNSNLKPHTGDFGTRKHSQARAGWRTEHIATRRNAPDRYNQAAFGRPKSKMLLPHRFAIGCEDGVASPCGCPEMGGYRCPSGIHRADRSCVLHGQCRMGWIIRSDIVWQKLNGLPESVTDRCRDSHEYLFHFTKEGRYFAAVDEVREPQTGGSHFGRSDGTAPPGGKAERLVATGNHGKNYGGTTNPGMFNPLGKLPGSVWALPSEPLIISDEVKAHYDLPDHFAAFPTELVRRVILGWSPSGVCVECGEGRRPVVAKKLLAQDRGDVGSRGSKFNGTKIAHSNGRLATDVVYGATEATITGYACSCATTDAPTRPAVVLDIFGGTGTTAGVARALGRTGISVDLSHDYCRLADYLVHRSTRFAKVVNRTNREAQRDLFGASA